MAIYELDVEQEIVLINNEPITKRPNFQLTETILVKIIQVTSVENNINTDKWWASFGKTVLCLLCAVEKVIEYDEDDNEIVTDVTVIEGEDDRRITCHNIRYNVPVLNNYYLAHRLNGTYVIDNQSCFKEFM